MFDDTFIAHLPRNQFLSDIEVVTEFVVKKIVAANRSYKTSSDVREKIDILLCLITYKSTLSLLNSAYLTEDIRMLDAAKETYRNLPNHQSHTSDFTDQDMEMFIDRITDATQASLALDLALLSHLTDNNHFMKEAKHIHKGIL